MEALIYVVIYLIGYVCSYLMYKKLMGHDNSLFNWTASHRNAGIVIAIGSWITFFVALIGYVCELLDSDEPANW